MAWCHVDSGLVPIMQLPNVDGRRIQLASYRGLEHTALSVRDSNGRNCLALNSMRGGRCR